MAKGIGKEITKTFAAMFAADKLAQFGAAAVDAAGQINDLSSRLGVSSEFLQEMKFAAEQSGASLEDVAGAVEKLSIARMKALAGDEATIENFNKMGVSMQTIKKLDGGGLFIESGKPFAEGIDPQKLIGPFRELAGKGAGALIPAMVQGLGESAQQARALGLIINTDVIDALDDVGDRMDTLKSITMSIGSTLIAYGVRPLLQFTEALVAGVQGFAIASKTPEGGKDMPGGERIRFMFGQFKESFMSSLDDQEQELLNKAERRKQRAGLTREGVESEGQKFKTVAVSAATGDQLARTGGFTAFQTNMDRYFGSVRTQAQDIRDIARHTERTAKAVEQ